MEQHLGRRLEPWEQVDHVNGDKTDDRLENYQLLTQTENIEKSKIRAELWKFQCPSCGKEFEALARRVRGNQEAQGKVGPFCSKSCSGRYNATVSK